MNNWISEAVFYHIYPLGAFGAPRNNDFFAAPMQRLEATDEMLEHLGRLGVNAVYLGPVFESGTHGYDTANFYEVDRRLGSNETLAWVVRRFHEQGIRVVLDGVFNHVGRNFWAFRDVIDKGENSQFVDWFAGLDFTRRSQNGDNFSYEGWNGNYDLVKLNLANEDVLQHLFAAVEMWIREFNIDGLRLDVADCLPFEFMQKLSSLCKSLRSDFWLMGEVVHGDYRKWVAPGILDSVTNYECYKGLYSSHVNKNYFEIAYSLNRQFGNDGIYKDFQLYNFVDNHDVTRIIDTLSQSRYLYPVHCLLFTMPGVPSIYYGSEWGIGGKKAGADDWPLRPCIDWRVQSVNRANKDLAGVIARLSALRSASDALKNGRYQQLYVNHEQFAFMRQTAEERMIVMVNASENAATVSVDVSFAADGECFDVLNSETLRVSNRTLKCELSPGWARIIRL
ncbi:MAG: alpha-glucosidase C-terminal domain-containing protein [Candidatus Riflebacteria bacterium]|nr:alpha-glucosidase C-terminal domain-containing protein [Candidatus Riflebacteria bacterium]